MLDRSLLHLRNLFLAIANVLLAAMLVANMVNIAWRAIFGTAFNAVFPWTTLGFVWLTFFGFYVFIYDRRDVVVDMIVKQLPAVVQRAAALFAVAVTLAILGIVLATLPRVLASQSDAIQMVGLPRYAMVLPLFLSAALVAVVTLRRVPEIWAGRTAEPHVPEGAD